MSARSKIYGSTDDYNDSVGLRPVWCFVCHRRMFYVGDEQFEPERRMEIISDHQHETRYVHERCWNILLSFIETETPGTDKPSPKAKPVRRIEVE